MALNKDVKLPTDAELAVPQEITLSTPYLKVCSISAVDYDCSRSKSSIELDLASLIRVLSGSRSVHALELRERDQGEHSDNLFFDQSSKL